MPQGLTRRSFFQLAAASSTAAFQASCSSNQADQPPNVLFLSVDDWNDWVGCLRGHPGVKTPNIDRLAERGTLFTNAHCPAPVCNPSRAATLTGLRPSTTGIYSNAHWLKPHLPTAVTLPEHFKRHGYRVEGGGKIFHDSPGFNDPDAWDFYYHWHEGNKRNGWVGGYNFTGPDPKPSNFPAAGVNKYRRNFDFAPLARPEPDFPDYKVASWACDFLSRPQPEPFFLAAGMYKPHIMWYAPRKYFDSYSLDGIRLPEVIKGDLDDIPAAGDAMRDHPEQHALVIERGKWKEAVRAYLAVISICDAQIGRVLGALDASPYADDTIIVLWSDHGYHLGEKENWHKFTLWEESTRVPFLMSVPGVTRPASRCDRPVSLIDIYPTLIDLCGLPPKPELDGESLLPLLNQPSAARETPALITQGRGNHAVRSERWRYIRYRDGSEELYDHASDPNEWTNLAADPGYAEVKKSLARWLPNREAHEAPRKDAYDFDPVKYEWNGKPIG